MRLPQTLALVAVAILGLMLIHDDSESAPPAPVAVVTPTQPQGAPAGAAATGDFLKSVHHVRAGNGSGTAVAVSDDTLYTAKHVVKDQQFAYIAVDRQWVLVNVTPIPGDIDGAILKLADAEKSKHKLAGVPVRSAKYREAVTLYGTRSNARQRGLVTSATSISLDETEQGVNFGDSGGPIVAGDGKMVGLISGFEAAQQHLGTEPNQRVVHFARAELFSQPNAVAKAQPSNSPAPQNCPGGVCPQPQAIQQQPQFYQFQQRGAIRYRIGN